MYMAHSQLGKNSLCISPSYDIYIYIIYLCDICIYEYTCTYINKYISLW